MQLPKKPVEVTEGPTHWYAANVFRTFGLGPEIPTIMANISIKLN